MKIIQNTNAFSFHLRYEERNSYIRATNFDRKLLSVVYQLPYKLVKIIPKTWNISNNNFHISSYLQR